MLKIAPADLEALRRHGEETYPHECCGALLGHNDGETRTVRQVVRTTNISTERARDYYQIAPEELIRIQRQARQSGLEIVGFYHSHPDDRAMWSATDFAEAHWIGCSYVITEVRAGKAAQTNAFALLGETEENKRFEQEEIEVASLPIPAEGTGGAGL